MSTAIETLQKKWQEVLNEKTAAIAKYDAELAELDKAIEALCGKKLNQEEFHYDDENTTYIAGTEDGI